MLRDRKGILPYVLIFPGILVVVVVLVYPLIRGVYSSFFHQQMIGEPMEFVGLRNYIKLFSDNIFSRSFFNSLIWTFSVVFFSYVFGLITALFLNEDFPGRGIYRSLILIPWVVPTVVAALTWKWIYSSQFGILNYILNSLGLIGEDIAWLGSTDLAFPAVIVTAVWRTIPFIAVVLLAGLQGISPDLYESAKIAGANIIQRFWYITMPMLKKVSLIAILLQCIWNFNLFEVIYIMTKGGPAHSTQILPVYTYLNAFQHFRLNYGAAIATVGLIILSIFAFLYMKISKMDEEEI